MCGDELTFRYLFIGLMTFFYGFRIYFMYLQKTEKKPEGKTKEYMLDTVLTKIYLAFFLISVILYIFFPQAISSYSIFLEPWLRWLGAGLLLISQPIFIWIHLLLKDNYSHVIESKKGQELITSGPYAWVRHPMYLASIPFSIGIALLSASLLFFVPSLMLVEMALVRIPGEEKMLNEKFGKKYAEYSKKVKYRMLPGVW